MTKLTTNKAGTEIHGKDGKKIVFRVEVPNRLTPAAIEGVLAAMDLDSPTLEQDLASALELAAKRKGSVIPDDYRVQYGVDQNCGDDIAERLRAKAVVVEGKKEFADMEKLGEIASANGLADKFDVWMTKGLNNGMVRMNLGNVLRGKARRGEEVLGLD